MYEVNFETADAAVNAALALHQALHATTGRARPGCGSASMSGRSSRSSGRRSPHPSGRPGDGRLPAVDRLASGRPDAPDPHGVRHRAGARPASSRSRAKAQPAELRWRAHGRFC